MCNFASEVTLGFIRRALARMGIRGRAPGKIILLVFFLSYLSPQSIFIQVKLGLNEY